MKKYVPNLCTFTFIVALLLLGNSPRFSFIYETNIVIAKVLSELVFIFIGISVGLFVKQFSVSLLWTLATACFFGGCIFLGLFSSMTYELVVAETIVVLAFASISNLHNIQKQHVR